jgi:hypothetical protein
MTTTTPTQDKVIRRLERKGFRVTRITRFEEDEAPMAFLSRRRGSSLHLCQLDPDGAVHGYFEWPAPMAAVTNQTNQPKGIIHHG